MKDEELASCREAEGKVDSNWRPNKANWKNWSMPTYKTSGSQCAVDIEKANRVLQRTILKRGISRSSHDERRKVEE